MCGISGWFGVAPIPIYLKDFCKMSLELLTHRGPDGNGFWMDKEFKTVLCHTRLAIIGLESSGLQPMNCVGGKWQIAFNGEIYNYKDLRKDLILDGYVFKTKTDTEVLAASFDKWGLDAFSKFRGMYAVALWNTVEKEGYLARDPFGIKPLYIKKSNKGLFFASELRLLLKISNEQKSLNLDAVAAYLATGSVPEPITIVSGIEMLQSGTILKIKNGVPSTVKRTQIRFDSTTSENHKDFEKKIRFSLLESVKSHLVSDVPVGLFLSGGIDSSCLAASLAILELKNTACFTISFGKHNLSEADSAKKTASYFGLDYFCKEILECESIELLQRYHNHLDQPSIDGLNVYAVSEYASSLGYKVVMSGLGADELLGGYPSFRRLPALIKILEKVSYSYVLFQKLFNSYPSPKLKRLGDMFKNGYDAGALYRSYRGIFSETEISRILNILGSSSNLDWKIYTDTFSKLDNTLEMISEVELKKYMLNQLLRDSDVMSMSNHIELRVPYLDINLFDAICQVPANKRYNKKQCLINAFPELPDWVTKVQKKGFLFPIQTWLKGCWANQKTWIDKKAGIDVQLWYRKLALITLEKWLQINMGINEK